MSCPSCAEAAAMVSHSFSAGCKACEARGLARIFLRRGERGRKLQKACEQFALQPSDVHKAWAVDAMNTEAKR